jgi:allantoicase
LFETELRRLGRVTHVRLNVMPDGGVARLRVWGEPESAHDARLERLNALSRPEAVEALRAVCGSLRWAERMVDARPFEDVPALYRIGERTFFELSEQDWLEAFSAHLRIGQRAHGADTHARWSAHEQSGVGAAAAPDLERLNQEYFDKFGFVFLICATGKSGEEMLSALRARLGNDRAREIRTAAEEQAMILRLRLGKLLEGT